MIRWVVLGALAASAGCADEAGPRLDTAEPPGARTGELVTLTGQRLCGADHDCSTAGGAVRIGLAAPIVLATIASYDDTSMQIVIPPITPVGPTDLVLTVNERSSNALAFEVLP